MGSEFHPDTVRLGSLLSIADQIQAFSLARKTGEIRVTNVPPPAYITMVDGEVVDSQFGARSGLDAAIALINLIEAHTEFVTGQKPHRQTISMSPSQILVSAALRRDEQGPSTVTPSTSPAVRPTLQVALKSEARTHTLQPGLASVGRDDVNDIVIPDPTVSKKHAIIECSPNGVFLKDLGSTNGTYVEGERITERWLNGRVNVQFGLVPAVFDSSAGK
jgi:hypothetical protein